MNDVAKIPPYADLAKKIREGHKAVADRMKDTIWKAIEVGEWIQEVKDKLPHGQFLPWLKDNCDVAERSAEVYMELAKGKPTIIAKLEELKSATAADLKDPKKELTIRSALRLLKGSKGRAKAEPKPETVIESALEKLLPALQSLKQSNDAGARAAAQKIVERLAKADLLERVPLKVAG